MPVLSADALRDAAARLLRALGAHAGEAECVAAHLVRADLRGVSTHGVQAIQMYAEFLRDGDIRPGVAPSLSEESPSTALVDGHWGFGQVVADFATETAIAKARATGVGLVGVCRCNHIGALADYTEKIAECDLLGFMVANSDAIVAPAGGATAQLGTNPLSFAAPVEGRPPFVVDMATSAITWGAAVRAQTLGEPVAEGTLLDAHGNPTTDPAAFFGPPLGSILPLAGYKGYALALTVEVMAGAFTGTGCAGEMGETPQGVLLLAADAARFGGAEEFRGHTERLLERVKASQRVPGVEEILYPGEPEARREAERRRSGIPLEDPVWKTLQEIAATAGIALQA
jgi:LDH2 family malate/lactate/ureidoglycolate dehydrogenase